MKKLARRRKKETKLKEGANGKINAARDTRFATKSDRASSVSA